MMTLLLLRLDNVLLLLLLMMMLLPAGLRWRHASSQRQNPSALLLRAEQCSPVSAGQHGNMLL